MQLRVIMEKISSMVCETISHFVQLKLCGAFLCSREKNIIPNLIVLLEEAAFSCFWRLLSKLSLNN